MHSSMGIIDLKTVFRIQKCAEKLSGGEPLNNIHFDPDEFLSSPQFLKIARLETIHIYLRRTNGHHFHFLIIKLDFKT